MRDVATPILDTGLRVEEALGLVWRDVQLTPANGAKYGFVRICGGKSRSAKRNILLPPPSKEHARDPACERSPLGVHGWARRAAFAIYCPEPTRGTP